MKSRFYINHSSAQLRPDCQSVHNQIVDEHGSNSFVQHERCHHYVLQNIMMTMLTLNRKIGHMLESIKMRYYPVSRVDFSGEWVGWR